MNNKSKYIWIAFILLLLLPTTVGRLLIDMASGIIILFFVMFLLVGGIGWFSWKKLKSNLISCNVCGATYMLNASNCPICGASKSNSSDQINNNVPASSATIDIKAEETN